MGTGGVRRFAAGGVLKTDDNLWLEFSSPRAMGVTEAMGRNVEAIGAARESLLAYLAPAPAGPEREARKRRWQVLGAAGSLIDRAHALFLEGGRGTDEFAAIVAAVEKAAPGYAPARFLRREDAEEEARTPRLLRAESYSVADAPGIQGSPAASGARAASGAPPTARAQATPGAPGTPQDSAASGASRSYGALEISAVTMMVGESRGVIVFVDNREREIYGQVYVDGTGPEVAARIESIALEIFAALKAAYDDQLLAARSRGSAVPLRADAARALKLAVTRRIECAP